MIGRVFRRVPVSVPTSSSISFLLIALLCGVLAVVALGATARTSAADWSPWQVASPPDLTLETLEGDRVSLADVDDAVVVVHFFATWCEPCRPELIALEQMVQAFEGQPLAILAVDSGEPEARIRRFFAENPVSFPILLDGDRSALKAWDVSTFPTSFIVGKDRQPLLIAEGPVAWDSDAVAADIAGLLEAAEAAHRQSP
jgi:peroxiredoxin